MGLKRILILGSDGDFCRRIERLFDGRAANTQIVLDYVEGLERLIYEKPDMAVLEIIGAGPGDWLVESIKQSDLFEIVEYRAQGWEVSLSPVLVVEAQSDIAPLGDFIEQYIGDGAPDPAVPNTQLRGRLNGLYYPRLIIDIYREGRTGILYVESWAGLKVYFHNGNPVFAEGGRLETALGRMLLEGGKISQEVYERAIREGADSGDKIGTVLMRMGVLSPHELNDLLLEQVKEKILSGFNCLQGYFWFESQSEFSNSVITYPISALEILFEGIGRYVDLAQLEGVFRLNEGASPKAHLNPERKDELEQCGLTPRELRFIHLIKDGATIDEMLQSTTLDRLHALRMLYLMYLLGYLRVPVVEEAESSFWSQITPESDGARGLKAEGEHQPGAIDEGVGGEQTGSRGDSVRDGSYEPDFIMLEEEVHQGEKSVDKVSSGGAGEAARREEQPQQSSEGVEGPGGRGRGDTPGESIEEFLTRAGGIYGSPQIAEGDSDDDSDSADSSLGVGLPPRESNEGNRNEGGEARPSEPPEGSPEGQQEREIAEIMDSSNPSRGEGESHSGEDSAPNSEFTTASNPPESGPWARGKDKRADIKKEVIRLEELESIFRREESPRPHRGAGGRRGAEKVQSGSETTISPVQKEALIGEISELYPTLTHQDHYQILGLERCATLYDIKEAYFRLAKKFHPDRTGFLDGEWKQKAEHIFVMISKAYDVLSDSVRRERYDTMGDEETMREQVKGLFEAETAFNEGEVFIKSKDFDLAIKRFQKAAELNPQEAKHKAYLAWAKFLGATDKDSVISQLRDELERAIDLNPDCAHAHYFLGVMHKYADDMRTAERSFSKALECDRDFQEAKRELWLLGKRKTRVGGKDKGKERGKTLWSIFKK